MTDSMLPIIRQMLNAESDRSRAEILLMVSDAVLVKYREQFEAACRRAGFELGLEFIMIRRAAFGAVRGPDGLHKNPLFEDARRQMAAFVADEGPAEGRKGDRPSGLMARPSAGEAEGQKT